MHCRSIRPLLTSFSLAIAAIAFADTPPRLETGQLGALEARAIGPATTSGRIMAIDAVIKDPKIVYVGAASGGIWKSTNGGTTFKPVFDKYTASIGALAIDQTRPETVWAGTGEACPRNSISVGDGIYKTTDGGENWSKLGLEKSEHIAKIVIDPKSPDTLYVAALGHVWDANDERGVFKTTDAGKTWERILFVDRDTGAADLVIDPQEPRILYAAMWQFRRTPYSFNSGGPGSGLYKSVDAGKTWKKLTAGLSEGPLGRIAVAVAPSRPSVVYANVEAKKTKLFRSEDGGTSWTEQADSFAITARPFYFSHLAVDPKDHNRIYKPGFSLAVSSDGGSTFSSPFGAEGGDIHSDLHALWINPSDPMQLLLGTDGGVFTSNDRGHNWVFLANLPVSQFYHVSVDLQRPYRVYGGLQDNGSWSGPSRSPGGIQNRDWENVGMGDGFHAFAEPADPDVIYCEYQGGNLLRRHRSTGETKEIRPYPAAGEPKLRFNWNTPMAISSKNPKLIYVGAQFLFSSSDRGESWKRLSNDLTTNDTEKQKQEESGGLTIDNSTAENHCTIFTISPSPLDENEIWAGTDDGNLQVTRDGGRNWSRVDRNIPGLPSGTWVSGVDASHHDPGTAYATFDGHQTGDLSPRVFRTTDWGKTWTALVTSDVDGYAHVIREDLVDKNLLFLGTERGLFVSVDAGKNWARFGSTLPVVPVRDLAIHPRENDLVVATHGRGIYIVDDITPLRSMTAELMAKPAAPLPSRTALIHTPESLQEFSGDSQFVGDNFPEVASVTYYLKDRHVFGDLKLEVFDSAGVRLATLPAGKRRGINRVFWHMRKKPPKVPPAPLLAGRALVGPSVPEGTYTVKLTKGSETLSWPIEVAADPRLPHPKEDRASQQRSVLDLYDLQEKLGFVADSLTDIRDQAKARSEKSAKSRSLRQNLDSFASQLDRLHKTLVATREGFLTGEEQLRERVVDLYGAISSYGGRPTASQLDRKKVLEAEVDAAEKNFRKIVDRELAGLNSQIQGTGQDAMKLMTREEWEKKQS